MIDRRPALIARCAGVADVRDDGHGMPGYAVCEGGLMLDLSGMSGVRVDPKRWAARTDAGAT